MLAGKGRVKPSDALSDAVAISSKKMAEPRSNAFCIGFPPSGSCVLLLGRSFCFLPGCSLWVNGSLEFRARSEFRNCACQNLEGSTSARVLADAGCALHGLERSKADQRDRVTFLDSKLDGFNQGVQDAASSDFGQFIFGNNFFDEFNAIHFLTVNS